MDKQNQCSCVAQELELYDRSKTPNKEMQLVCRFSLLAPTDVLLAHRERQKFEESEKSTRFEKSVHQSVVCQSNSKK